MTGKNAKDNRWIIFGILAVFIFIWGGLHFFYAGIGEEAHTYFNIFTRGLTAIVLGGVIVASLRVKNRSAKKYIFVGAFLLLCGERGGIGAFFLVSIENYLPYLAFIVLVGALMVLKGIEEVIK